MTRICPNCNAPLQEGAQFCPHCMFSLVDPTLIQKEPHPDEPKKRKKRWILPLVLSLVIAILIGTLCTVLYTKKHAVLCSYDQFVLAATRVSSVLELGDLWSPEEFSDVRHSRKDKTIQYVAPVALEDATLSVFFYNKGEEIHAYLSDLHSEDFDDGETLIKAIVQSVGNSFFTDIDNVFANEKVYPKKPMSEPFPTYYTDLLGRTETYEQDIKNGVMISTKTLSMFTDADTLITYYVIERLSDTGLVYDLALDYGRMPS